jgi:hypothetical protein
VRLWLLLGLAFSLGCGGRAPGLVTEGDFEPLSEFEGVPSGWSATSVPHTADFVDFVWDREVAHSGERSISIAISEDHPDEPIAYNWTRVVNGWEIGQAYELSGWIRTDMLAETAWIVVQFWNLEYGEMVDFASTQSDHQLRGTNDWTRVHEEFEVPYGTEQVRIRAGIAAPDNRGGRVWFDGIAIRKRH